MIRKINLHGKIRRAFLYIGIGFIFTIILFWGLLGHQNAIPAANAMQVDDSQGNPSSEIEYIIDMPEAGPQIISEQPEELGMITAPPDGQEEPANEPGLSPVSAPALAPSPAPTSTPIDVNSLVDFYKLEEKHYYSDYGYSSNHYEYTDEELYMLARLIYGEARGESLKGKIAVGNVVMNRVLARGYPGDTIKAVVTASGQFTGYSASIKPDSACMFAAGQVLDKEFGSYRRTSISSTQADLPEKIGGTINITQELMGTVFIPKIIADETETEIYHLPCMNASINGRSMDVSRGKEYIGYSTYSTNWDTT
jgi:hypothetical protein